MGDDQELFVDAEMEPDQELNSLTNAIVGDLISEGDEISSGILVNFNVRALKDGLKRVVN